MLNYIYQKLIIEIIYFLQFVSQNVKTNNNNLYKVPNNLVFPYNKISPKCSSFRKSNIVKYSFLVKYTISFQSLGMNLT